MKPGVPANRGPRCAHRRPPHLGRRDGPWRPPNWPVTPRSTIHTCCFQRDQRLRLRPALLLTWKPLRRCRCAQVDPHRQTCTAAPACRMSGTNCQVTGCCPWCGVHVRARMASLQAPAPPLRSSASAPPRLPRRCMEGHLALLGFASHLLAPHSGHAVCSVTTS